MEQARKLLTTAEGISAVLAQAVMLIDATDKPMEPDSLTAKPDQLREKLLEVCGPHKKVDTTKSLGRWRGAGCKQRLNRESLWRSCAKKPSVCSGPCLLPLGTPEVHQGALRYIRLVNT
jgi:hypothetical protein